MIEIKPTPEYDAESVKPIVVKCAGRPAPTWRPAVKVEPCVLDMTLLKPKPPVKKAPVAPVEKPQSTERPPAIVCWVEWDEKFYQFAIKNGKQPKAPVLWVGRHTGGRKYDMTRYSHKAKVSRETGLTIDQESISSKHGCDIEQIRLTEKSSMTLAFWAGDPTDPNAMKKKLSVAVRETSEALGMRPAEKAARNGAKAIQKKVPVKAQKLGSCSSCNKPFKQMGAPVKVQGREGKFCHECALAQPSKQQFGKPIALAEAPESWAAY